MNLENDMALKIIRWAIVEPVNGRRLTQGDEILVSDRRCKVISTPPNPRPIEFKSIDGCLETFKNRFHVYYKLLDYEEYDACIRCGKPVEEGEICFDCKIEDVKYMDTDSVVC